LENPGDAVKKERMIARLDGIMEFSLSAMVFVLPFSKAGVEIFFSWMFTCWLVKRSLSYSPRPTVYSPQTFDFRKCVKEKIGGLIKAFRPIETKLNLPIGVFVLVGFLSMVNSVSITLSLEGFFLKLLEWIMIYFILIEIINNRKRLNRILIVLIFSMALIAIDGIFQYITGKEFIFLHSYSIGVGAGRKIQACFGNPNNFAGWLVVMVPLALSLAYSGVNGWPKRRVLRLTLWLITVLLVVCLSLTYTRGAWMATVLSLIFLGIFSGKKLLIIIMIALLLIPFVASERMKERMASTVQIRELLKMKRPYIWRESLSIIEDFPLFGSGLNTYATVGPDYRISKGGGFYPHNSYLHMAAEAGLLGLGAFIWIMASLFKTSLANLKRIDDKFYSVFLIGLLAGLFGFLLHSFVDTNIYTLQLGNLMWFVMGLIVSIQKIALEQKRISTVRG